MRLTVEFIQRTVAAHYGEGLCSMLDGRHPDQVRRRHEAMLIARRVTRKSSRIICKPFGLESSTIRHGWRAAERRFLSDPEVRRNVGEIVGKLLG